MLILLYYTDCGHSNVINKSDADFGNLKLNLLSHTDFGHSNDSVKLVSEYSMLHSYRETHETEVNTHTHKKNTYTRPQEQGNRTDVVSTVFISLLTASIEELKLERVGGEGGDKVRHTCAREPGDFQQ